MNREIIGCFKTLAPIPLGAQRGGNSCRRLAQASNGVVCDVGDYWKGSASWKKLLQFVVHIYLRGGSGFFWENFWFSFLLVHFLPYFLLFPEM